VPPVPGRFGIKARKGKLRFTGSPVALIEANGFLPLAISPAHAEAAGRLAWTHRDPFDRVLVVQAQRERLVLVHADPIIGSFEHVTQLWADAGL
jgi:PIN domain nuclease of toxin-antitoxin system